MQATKHALNTNGFFLVHSVYSILINSDIHLPPVILSSFFAKLHNIIWKVRIPLKIRFPFGILSQITPIYTVWLHLLCHQKFGNILFYLILFFKERSGNNFDNQILVGQFGSQTRHSESHYNTTLIGKSKRQLTLQSATNIYNLTLRRDHIQFFFKLHK